MILETVVNPKVSSLIVVINYHLLIVEFYEYLNNVEIILGSMHVHPIGHILSYPFLSLVIDIIGAFPPFHVPQGHDYLI